LLYRLTQVHLEKCSLKWRENEKPIVIYWDKIRELLHRDTDHPHQFLPTMMSSVHINEYVSLIKFLNIEAGEFFPSCFDTVVLGDSKDIRPVKCYVLVCWW